MSDDKLKDNEVQVGQRRIGGDTVIQINLKTVLVALGLLGSGLGFLWNNVTNKMDSYNTTTKTQVESLKEEIKEIKNQDLKTISTQLNQVDGKVQGIFMNMQRNDYNPNTQPTVTHNNSIHVPTDTVRPINPNTP